MRILLTPLSAYRLFTAEKSLARDGHTFKSFKKYHAASGLMLATGAKLHCGYDGYMVCGYTGDGRDVEAYRKYAAK